MNITKNHILLITFSFLTIFNVFPGLVPLCLIKIAKKNSNGERTLLGKIITRDDDNTDFEINDNEVTIQGYKRTANKSPEKKDTLLVTFYHKGILVGTRLVELDVEDDEDTMIKWSIYFFS